MRRFVSPAALLILGALAGPAAAQDPAREVAADLDGDGVTETYRIEDGAETVVDLVVAEAGEERRVEGIAWTGVMAGTLPGLSLSEAGSVVLTSMNDAVGRDRWRIDLTIAHRDGDWRVAGLTYEWRDTIDPDAWGICDQNLLSGRAELEGPAGVRRFAPIGPAPRLWDWSDEGARDWIEPCIG